MPGAIMTILGRYETWGRLSRGGMSEVWLARHRALGLPVVLKTLRPELARRVGGAEESLGTTARLMARVTAPEIVRVLDLGADVVDPDGGAVVPCLVEEYVDGLDLAELDARRRDALGRPLPLWLVADLVAQAAAGLHAAHQVGVVHRDVKPANLFADASGRVRVGDFGIAVAPRETRRCEIAGTPLFMAPETLSGEAPDRRADVFSLGATAFALRFGAPPWADSGAVVRGDAPAAFPPPKSADEAALQHLLSGAMACRPDARPRSAGFLAEALRALSLRARPTLSWSEPTRDTYVLGGLRVRLEIGDLSRARTDAIVSSAYSEMRMDQGVGLALSRAGGSAIEDEAMRGGPRALGECVVTGAGALSCRRVLHAVGAWNEVSCIARALLRALWIAERHGDRSIAMPAIGTGRGRVSFASCADTIGSALRLHALLGGRLEEVRIVLADAPSRDAFAEVFAGLHRGTDADGDDDTAGGASGTAPTELVHQMARAVA